MGKWHVGHRLDLFDVDNAQVCLPAVVLEQGAVVGAEVAGQCLASDARVEHAAHAGHYGIHAIVSGLSVRTLQILRCEYLVRSIS